MSFYALHDEQKFELQNYCSFLLHKVGLDSINSQYRCKAISHIRLDIGVSKVVQCQYQEGHFSPHAASIGSVSYYYPEEETMGSRGISVMWGDGKEPTEEVVKVLLALAKVEDEEA